MDRDILTHILICKCASYSLMLSNNFVKDALLVFMCETNSVSFVCIIESKTDLTYCMVIK